MLAAGFNPDLPAAVVALIPLILIVSAVDAGVAEEWTIRKKEEYGVARLQGRRLVRPLGIAWAILASGFVALVAALLELKWQTNRFDTLILALSLVPVAGLVVHLTCRVFRQVKS